MKDERERMGGSERKEEEGENSLLIRRDTLTKYDQDYLFLAVH